MKKLYHLILCFALCLTMVSCTISDEVDIKTSDTPVQTTNTVESTSVETTKQSSIIYLGEPDIYPSVWYTMNAAIITWGEYNGNNTIYYEGIEVKYDKIFSETVKTVIEDYYGNNFDFEDELLDLGFLYVPESYLSYAVYGETALVFTECIGITTVTNDAGSPEDAPYIVVSVLFPIINDAISVPNDEYTLNSLIYCYLTEGNTFMEKNYPDVDIRFEDGMTVEEFGKFVEYLCTEADGLIYP
ncbi:MAG: hypothetical protein LUI61_05975 [Firmicutes bacterium]|nr:hypothetical protein [Bacillota bacterium]